MLKQPPNLAEEISALAKINEGSSVTSVTEPLDITVNLEALESILGSKRRKKREGLVQERIISVIFFSYIIKNLIKVVLPSYF